MTALGTFYDHSAEIEAVFNRFNSGTAYGGNLVDNSELHLIRDKVPSTRAKQRAAH